MKSEYIKPLIAQMDSLEVGNFFNYWIAMKDCYLIVKLKGQGRGDKNDKSR